MLNAEQKQITEDEETRWNGDILYSLGLKRQEIMKLRSLVNSRVRYHLRDRMKTVTIGTEGDFEVCTGQEYIIERTVQMPNGKDYRIAYFSNGLEISADEANQYPTVDLSENNCIDNIRKLFDTNSSSGGLALRQFDKVAIASYVNRIVDYRENKFLRKTSRQMMAQLNMGEGTVVVYPEPQFDILGGRLPIQEEE